MPLWILPRDSNRWAGEINTHIPFLTSAIYKILKSDQAAGVFALTMIVTNTMVSHVNEVATLALTTLSIIWVGFKLANEIILRKKLKNKE